MYPKGEFEKSMVTSDNGPRDSKVSPLLRPLWHPLYHLSGRCLRNYRLFRGRESREGWVGYDGRLAASEKCLWSVTTLLPLFFFLLLYRPTPFPGVYCWRWEVDSERMGHTCAAHSRFFFLPSFLPSIPTRPNALHRRLCSSLLAKPVELS